MPGAIRGLLININKFNDAIIIIRSSSQINTMKSQENQQDSLKPIHKHLFALSAEVNLKTNQTSPKQKPTSDTGTSQISIQAPSIRQLEPGPTLLIPEDSERSSGSCVSSERENIKSASSGKPSVFQNFQKHLVRTLKSEIIIPKDRNSDPIIHLALRMWRIFLDSHYYSKRILYFLFGVSTLSKVSEKNQTYEKFIQISNVYPPEEIELAQEFLRGEVVRQGSKLLSTDFLQNRRIEKVEQFLKYFQNFLSELQQGAVSRRVLKSSLKIQEKFRHKE